jgi:hypothetical protein
VRWPLERVADRAALCSSAWRAAASGASPGGGSVRGKESSTHSTIETVRMMVPARRRKARAAPQTCEASRRSGGTR